MPFEALPRPADGPGAAAVAQLRLIVWCKACQHQVEPDPAEMAARYGADTSVLDWRERLVCSESGCREVHFVVTGAVRRAGWIHSQPPALADVSSLAEIVGGFDLLPASCATPSAMAWISNEPRLPAPWALSS
jgi:hypothetical protein